MPASNFALNAGGLSQGLPETAPLQAPRPPKASQIAFIYDNFWAFRYVRPYPLEYTGSVRSPLVKPVRAGLVVGSVTTSEYLVLYVFFALFDLHSLTVSDNANSTCNSANQAGKFPFTTLV